MHLYRLYTSRGGTLLRMNNFLSIINLLWLIYCVGDMGRRPWRFLHRSSPSQGDFSKPSPVNNASNTPSSFLQETNDHTTEPWLEWSRGWIGPKLRFSGARGGWTEGPPWRWMVTFWRLSVCRRPLNPVMWCSGHVSHPHLWDMEIVVNHKGL
jgi:hypothetical protein